MRGAYLARLGVRIAQPSVDYLFALHRAHVERVPYTNLEIMRGRVTPIDQLASVRQILAGLGGYCFHLNGGLAWLLRQLGFAVTLHRGYVYRHGAETASLNHLVLLVHDLDGVWFVDAGLGDALHEPLPLASGTYEQGPFRYTLSAGERWRFTHDEAGGFAAMEFEPAAARLEDFAQAHHTLSTSDDSPFRRFLTAQVRQADRVTILRACTLVDISAGGTQTRAVETLPQWRAALAGLGLTGCDDLWEQTREAHEEWLATL